MELDTLNPKPTTNGNNLRTTNIRNETKLITQLFFPYKVHEVGFVAFK